MQRKRPVLNRPKTWLQKLLRWFRRWAPLYWLRTHTLDRYHIINIKGQGDYTWGWCDRDHAMLLACFKILTEFVELEDPFKYHFSWTDEKFEKELEECKYEDEVDHRRHQHAVGQEIKALYLWWKEGRSKEHDEVEELYRKIDTKGEGLFDRSVKEEGGLTRWIHPSYMDSPEWEAWVKADLGKAERDEEMLMRLMKIRRHLWT